MVATAPTPTRVENCEPLPASLRALDPTGKGPGPVKAEPGFLTSPNKTEKAQRRAAIALLVNEVGSYFTSPGGSQFGLAAIEDGGDGRVLGAAVAAQLHEDDRQHMLRHVTPLPHARLFVDDLRGGAAAGNLLALAVSPAARRQGIGARLVRARLAYFLDRGFDLAVAVSWDKPEHSSVPLYDRLGFIRLAASPVARYWYRSSSEARAVGPVDGCPICGAPCECSAVLFGVRLDRRRPT